MKGWEKWNKVLHFLFQSSIWMELCSPTITKESLSAIIIIVTNHIFSRMLCQKNSSLSFFFYIYIYLYIYHTLGKKYTCHFGNFFFWIWVGFGHFTSFLAAVRRFWQFNDGNQLPGCRLFASYDIYVYLFILFITW